MEGKFDESMAVMIREPIPAWDHPLEVNKNVETSTIGKILIAHLDEVFREGNCPIFCLLT